MQALKTQINPQSSEFRANADTMRALVDDLRTKVTDMAQGGGEAARARHTARGKLLPRDRVSQLLDPGTPFLEIGQLACFGMYDGDAPAAGLIAGIGCVQGVQCMVVANDATVRDSDAGACARNSGPCPQRARRELGEPKPSWIS